MLKIKKGVSINLIFITVLVLMIISIMSFSVIAQDYDPVKVDKAYTYVENRVESTTWSSMNLREDGKRRSHPPSSAWRTPWKPV